MISLLTGTVRAIDKQMILLDVHGIGFEVAVPQNTVLTQGSTASLHLYMHWNQESGPSLFGFLHEFEKKVFLLVISCSGMGPKIGLAVIGNLGPKAFIDAVLAGNHDVLSAVPGIGGKKAEQLVVQLRHKIEKLMQDGLEGCVPAGESMHMSQVAQVLTSLNYTRQEVSRAMRHVQESEVATGSFDQVMRQALSFLAKK